MLKNWIYMRNVESVEKRYFRKSEGLSFIAVIIIYLSISSLYYEPNLEVESLWYHKIYH